MNAQDIIAFDASKPTFAGIAIEDSKPKEKDNEKPKKDPFHNENCSRAYLAGPGRGYLSLDGGRTLKYDGNSYSEVVEMSREVRKFLTKGEVPVSNNLVGNICPLVQSMTHDPEVRAVPFFKGRPDIDPRRVVAFENGLLNLDDTAGGLIPHTPAWVSMSCLPYAYDPAAECPRFLAFLDETFEGDAQRIALLQEYAGYLMTADNSRQKMLALVGVSRGGKGVVASVLQRLLGDGNYTGYCLTSLGNQFGLGGLVGRQAAFVGEVNLQKHHKRYEILSRLNSITGGDEVQIEIKHQALMQSVRLYTRFVIACNMFPVFADPTGALSERVLCLNFQRAVAEQDRDPYLADKLASEIGGIAAWALRGLERLDRQGWTRPDLSAETVTEIRRDASPVVAFAQDRLKVSRTFDTGNLPGVEIVHEDVQVMKSTLMQAYAEWLANESRDGNPSYLLRDLHAMMPKIRESKIRSDGVRVRVIVGIDLK